jgi:VCBS repeat-containing protein
MARRRQSAVRSRRRSRDLLLEALEGRRLLAGIVAVGSDTGASSTSLVRLVDAETGAQQASVMAFETTFRGGVRLAMGRVTGNAAADLVVGSGSGRAAEVKVFRPVTTGATTSLQQVLAFNPFGAGYRGGIEVAVGDVDGDSSEDIVVAKSREGGEVRVFRMTNGGTRATLYATIASPFGPGYNGGSSVGVADVGEFTNGALVKSVGDNKVEILVGSGAGITAQVRVYDVSRPSSPRVADTILPAFNAAYGRPFTGGVTATGGRYAASGVADSIDEIVISAGRGGSGAAQTIVYDGTVSAAANAIRRGFTTYGAAERPNAAVFTAAVDADGNGQVDRFLVTQGDPGGPAGIANVSVAGVRAAAPVTSLAGPLRIATPRTVFQPQTINGTVATPSPTAGVAAGASRPMQTREIVTGAGTTASVGNTLTVQYTGMLTDGTVFDSSRQAGRSAFQFTLGSGQVIPGWEAGLAGMKVGGRRLLVIPPELAYGDAARTGIPAKSTLVFDVELVGVSGNATATIGGTSTGAVTEKAATSTASGTLTVSDPDAGQAVFAAPGALNKTYGTFTFDATSGAWTYALDNTRAATQALKAGQTVTDSLTVTSLDGTASRAIVVTITGATDAPTDIALSATTVAENAAVGTTVGTFTTTDVDVGDTFTYTLVSGEGSADNGSFTIDGAALKTSASFNLEAKGSYAIRVRSTDATGASFDKQFTVTVTNVNEAPTDISLSAATVAENAAVGTTVGTFTTTDVDAGDTFTYTLVTGTGDTDNAAFTIAGAALKTAASFNFEGKSSYAIRVRSTDATGAFVDKQFTVTVGNVNEAPTDISLSAANVAENSPIDTTVGTFTTTDVDAGDTFTYELVSGTGDTDNAAFAIAGASLKTAVVFDSEIKSSYSIRVRSTDATGAFVDKQFTVTVGNVNETPTDIALSATTVAENAAVGTTVGTFTTTDVDVGDTFTYTLVSGDGSADNGSFTIAGAALKTAASFDVETKGSYSIRVRSTDATGASFDKQFTVTVTNVNEAPTDISLSAATVAENAAVGTTVGTFTTTDVDAGDSFTYTLVTGTGDTDNVAFTIAGAALKTAASFNFEGKSSYSIRVRSTDATGAFVEKQFTITVTDVNDVASIGGTATGAVSVTDAPPTASGTLSVSDQDFGQAVFATPSSLGGVYGTFTFDAVTGAWTYTLDTARYWTWVLTSDRPVTDSLAVQSVDGSASETIAVTITGYAMQTMSAVVTSTNAAVPPGTVSSLQYREVSEGTGAVAEPGMLVAVHYIGYLDDASLFDSSLLPGREPFVFQLDAGQVIAGWDAGVAGMKVGGVRVLVIPPELAYGNSSQGLVPAGARLSFIVQVLAVQNP